MWRGASPTAACRHSERGWAATVIHIDLHWQTANCTSAVTDTARMSRANIGIARGTVSDRDTLATIDLTYQSQKLAKYLLLCVLRDGARGASFSMIDASASVPNPPARRNK